MLVHTPALQWTMIVLRCYGTLSTLDAKLIRIEKFPNSDRGKNSGRGIFNAREINYWLTFFCIPCIP